MKKKLTMLLLLFTVVSLSACGQTTKQDLPEETAASEDVGEETAEVKEEEASEEQTITPEEAATFSHNYTWGMMEFEGEDSFVMEVDLKGSPKASGSTITFRVVDSIFDYKPFTKITSGDLVVDKETYPDWATDGSTDGIFGFVDEDFTMTTDEEVAESTEPFVVTFSYTGTDGTSHEYSITWNPDGTAEVNEGSLTEN